MSVIAIYGCARTAPELPPNYTHNAGSPKELLSQVFLPIRGMTCDEIKKQLTNLSMHDSQLETEIHGNRGKNQASAYIAGVIFLPAILAVDNDKRAKILLDQNQKYRDELIFGQKAKDC
ncbi:MAG: hypothetical protein QGH78_03860 [Alphaproteobacteria bacterium]|jgi:hypothetical protein|nr:hypothetical protein [Alphaproteobacteria bacterium]|tara:strand:+ start:930 stop:1286 length:357 start_codon:yes stop_codon:yes gene_type:complete